MVGTKRGSERGSAFAFIRKVRRPHARAIFLLITIWLLLSLILVWPKLARWRDNSPLPQARLPGGYNYLIVAPRGFQSIARSWADYRRSTGYQAGVMIVEGDDATPEYVQWIVQQVYERSGRPYPFYVLLLGHAHPYSNFPQNYLPASGLNLADEHANLLGFNRLPSDGAYALEPESDVWLPMAIGRVPALTEEMAFSVLERVREYESNPPQGPGRARLEMITSSNDWGPTFDRLANGLLAYMLNRRLPDYVQVNSLSGNPLSPYSYPPEDFPKEVARRFNAGSTMVSYIGHGTRRGLAPAVSQTGEEDWIFTLSDLRRLQNANSTVAAFVACEVGEFDLPGNHLSLAESLFLTSDGMMATYAGSRITFEVANTLLERDLLLLMFADQVPTVGEWLRQAKESFANPGSDRTFADWVLRQSLPTIYSWLIPWGGSGKYVDLDDTLLWQRYAYNLFGDPALAIAYPDLGMSLQPRFKWQPFGKNLHFTGGGNLESGDMVYVTLSALPGEVSPGGPGDDDQAGTYLDANDRVLSQTLVPSDLSGSFAGKLSLPGGLSSGRYAIQALSLSDGSTIIGSHEVYLGFPLLEMLISTRLWWLGTTLMVVALVVKRAHYAFVPRPRDVNKGWPYYPHPVASSWQTQPGLSAGSPMVSRRNVRRRRRRRRWVGKHDPSSVPVLVRSAVEN